MCCDVLSKRRFARAADLTATVETYVCSSNSGVVQPLSSRTKKNHLTLAQLRPHASNMHVAAS